MMAAKAFWQVQAGLIPGQPMAQYNKAWSYTSQDYAEDGDERGYIFDEMRREAHDYATELERGGLNWVTLSYVWL